MLSFLLIHGTIPSFGPLRLFSRRSWTDDESEFVRSLRSSFPEAQIKRFAWDGINSHAARWKAGGDLASWIESQANLDSKGIQRILIAHSHGGNVALYAIKRLDEECLGQISGIVFLGTPFLRARARDSQTLSDLWLGAILGGLTLMGLLSVIVPKHHPILSLLFLACLLVTAVGIVRLVRTNRADWEQQGSKIAWEVDALPVGNMPIFCVCVKRDEALLLLNAMSFATTALISFRRRSLDWSKELIENLGETLRLFGTGVKNEIADRLPKDWWEGIGFAFCLVLFIAFSPLYLMMALLVLAFLGPFVILLFGPGLIGIIVLPIIALCATQFISLINLLTRSAPWGFGEHWLLQWIVEITASKWPQEERNFSSIEDHIGLWNLQHCAMTRYPRFIDEMSRWIVGTSMEEPTQNQREPGEDAQMEER